MDPQNCRASINERIDKTSQGQLNFSRNLYDVFLRFFFSSSDRERCSHLYVGPDVHNITSTNNSSNNSKKHPGLVRNFQLSGHLDQQQHIESARMSIDTVAIQLVHFV